MSEFLYGETELAEAAGLAAKHFQRARVKNLRQGTDWDLVALRVYYTKNATARVLELVTQRAVPAAELTVLLEKSRLTDPKKNGAAEIEATVSKFYLNPRLLGVKLPNGAMVNLRVRETKNFRLGMEVPVRATASGGYELARKLPRFWGRF